MKSKALTCIVATTLCGALAIPIRLAAQDNQEHRQQHHHYKLIDLGTFGGLYNYISGDDLLAPYKGPAQNVNAAGALIGWADTSTPDPYAPLCFNADCLVSHAFQWRNGFKTDLGVLPGGVNSATAWISTNSLIAGASQNGELDPLDSGFPEDRAVLWRDGNIIDLGTLPEGGYESGAQAVNSRGQVVGWAFNSVPDPYSMGLWSSLYNFYEPVYAYQERAFLWENGVMQDLGTLGTGTDAYAMAINERGQIVGVSYTNATPNEVSTSCSLLGSGALLPTQDPFLWEKGKMIDLGSLGGTCGFPSWLNDHGVVVGESDLAGDQFSHPFLWTKANGIQDLGTLGGNYGSSSMINDRGDVVGGATLAGDSQTDAFLWNGTMQDLGALNGCSYAWAINAHAQVVGNWGENGCQQGAFLWEDGGPMVDLNTLVSSTTGLSVAGAIEINDRGEIVGSATDGNGNYYAMLLIPCDENHPGVEGCDYTLADGSATVDVAHAHATNISSPLINSPATTVGQLNWLRGGILAGAHKRLAPDFHNSRAALSSVPHNLIASALNSYQIRINWQEASGQNQGGFNIYRCHGCPSPRTEGTRIASVGASVLSYTNGSTTSPLTETTTYTYQVTAFNSNGESGPSNASSAPTKTEPAPTNLSSFAFSRGVDDIVDLRWTNNSTDDNSYYVESCTGSTCTNFSTIAQLGANATTDTRYFEFAPDVTLRYRVRAHSPGGYSGYSNIRNQVLP